MKNRLWIFTGIACTLIASSAAADIIYDNFGPEDSFDSTVSVSVGGFSGFQFAFRFTVTGGDFALTSLTAPIGFVNGTNEVLLTIYSDFFTPFTTLETSTGSGFQDTGTPITPTEFGFSGSTILRDGEQYWVGFEPNDLFDDTLSWFLNDQEDFLLRSERFPGGSWAVPSASRSGAMRIEGNLVPAPAPIAVFGFGLSAILFRRQRD